MANRPISGRRLKLDYLPEGKEQSKQYKYVRTFGYVPDDSKKGNEIPEIPKEAIQAFIKEILAGRKETEKRVHKTNYYIEP